MFKAFLKLGLGNCKIFWYIGVFYVFFPLGHFEGVYDALPYLYNFDFLGLFRACQFGDTIMGFDKFIQTTRGQIISSLLLINIIVFPIAAYVAGIINPFALKERDRWWLIFAKAICNCFVYLIVFHLAIPLSILGFFLIIRYGAMYERYVGCVKFKGFYFKVYTEELFLRRQKNAVLCQDGSYLIEKSLPQFPGSIAYKLKFVTYDKGDSKRLDQLEVFYGEDSHSEIVESLDNSGFYLYFKDNLGSFYYNLDTIWLILSKISHTQVLIPEAKNLNQKCFAVIYRDMHRAGEEDPQLAKELTLSNIA